MRRSTPIVLFSVVALSATGVALPAQADPGPGPNTSVAVHVEALGQQPAEDYVSPPSATGTLTGDERRVDIAIPVDGGWSATFSAPTGRTLAAGQTFEVARSDSVGSDDDPGLQVNRSGARCGDDDSNPPERPVLSLGRFTVQQATFDGAGHPVQFAVTFEQNCQDTAQPALQGSMAVSAADPAAPIPAASPTPAALTHVTVSNHVIPTQTYSPRLDLAWKHPAGSAGTRTVVSFAQPAPFASNLDWYTTIYDGTGTSYSNPYWYEGISSFGFRLVPVSALGRLGTPTVVRLGGTRLDFEGRPSRVVMGQDAVLIGRLSKSVDDEPDADPMGGPGIAGQRIDVYSQPKGHWNDPWRFEGTTRTGSDGRIETHVAPLDNREYNIVFPGSSAYFGNGAMAPVNVNVAPRADLASARRAVRRHSAIKFTTSRTTAGSRSVVLLQRYSGHAWHTVATRRIKPAAHGRASQKQLIRYRAGARGSYLFRLAKPGDAKHVTGYSRTVRVKVR